MSMVSIAIIVGVLAVLICIGGLVYVVKLRWTKNQQHNHHLHHGLNHHHSLQKGKLVAMQTSTSGGGVGGGGMTNSSSNNPHSNNLLRRKNNGSLTRPGNLPIKDKILLPGGINNSCGSLGVGNHNSMHHNHHQQHSMAEEQQLYDEKNPDVVPYNKGKLRYFFTS